jgi:hypothetical protein
MRTLEVFAAPSDPFVEVRFDGAVNFDGREPQRRLRSYLRYTGHTLRHPI